MRKDMENYKLTDIRNLEKHRNFGDLREDLRKDISPSCGDDHESANLLLIF